MNKPLYIICGKCGSEDVRFKIDTPTESNESGVFAACGDCGELTSIEEINERRDEIKELK